MTPHIVENKEEESRSKLVQILESANKGLVKHSKRIARNFLKTTRDVAIVTFGVIAGMYVWEYTIKPIEEIDDPFKNETNIEKIVQDVKTWDGAREYLDKHFEYTLINEVPTSIGFNGTSPFNIIHRIGGGTCEGYTLAAYALLRDNKEYEVKGMSLKPKDKSLYKTFQNLKRIFRKKGSINYGNTGHSVCLVKDKLTGKYGALGQECDHIKPILNSPEDVFEELSRRLYNHWKEFELYDFDTSTVMYGKHVFDAPKYCYYDGSLEEAGEFPFTFSDEKRECAHELGPFNFPFNPKFEENPPEEFDKVINHLMSREYEERQKGIKMLDSLDIKDFRRDYIGSGWDLIYIPKRLEQPFQAFKIIISK